MKKLINTAAMKRNSCFLLPFLSIYILGPDQNLNYDVPHEDINIKRDTKDFITYLNFNENDIVSGHKFRENAGDWHVSTQMDDWLPRGANTSPMCKVEINQANYKKGRIKFINEN